MPAPDSTPTAAAPNPRFGLVRHFSLAALIAFVAVGIALYFMEQREYSFFHQVQLDQERRTVHAQHEYAMMEYESSRRELVTVHESAHANLTRILANALWAKHFQPLVTQTEKLYRKRCPSISSQAEAANNNVTDGPRACLVGIAPEVLALTDYARLNSAVAAATQGSSVFKIKVFDRNGITVYSSEKSQVGEDKAGNKGWQVAAAGSPASEMTHRDKFSTFEGVVENRDLISTYLPIHSADGKTLLGVFEIYSDVTPFLNQIVASSKRFMAVATENRKAMEKISADNRKVVANNSWAVLFTVGALLTLLYTVLLLIVKNAQKTLDAQARANEESIQREQDWHREKMAALATLAAAVAHETNNPLSTISMLADELEQQEPQHQAQLGLIRDEVFRIAKMTRRIADFASARGQTPAAVDVNHAIESVCDFLGFDRRTHNIHIITALGENLPALTLVPDHLTEVLMNLIQTVMKHTHETSSSEVQEVLVQSCSTGKEIAITITCRRGPEVEKNANVCGSEQFTSVTRRIAQLGGRLESSSTGIILKLPVSAEAQE